MKSPHSPFYKTWLEWKKKKNLFIESILKKKFIGRKRKKKKLGHIQNVTLDLLALGKKGKKN